MGQPKVVARIRVFFLSSCARGGLSVLARFQFCSVFNYPSFQVGYFFPLLFYLCLKAVVLFFLIGGFLYCLCLLYQGRFESSMSNWGSRFHPIYAVILRLPDATLGRHTLGIVSGQLMALLYLIIATLCGVTFMFVQNPTCSFRQMDRRHHMVHSIKVSTVGPTHRWPRLFWLVSKVNVATKTLVFPN